MSSEHPVVVLLYWGGKIILLGESIAYDPPICKKVLLLKERIGMMSWLIGSIMP